MMKMSQEFQEKVERMTTYNTKRAQGFMQLYGPEKGVEINKLLGLDQYLRQDSPATAMLAIGLLGNGKSREYRRQLKTLAGAGASTISSGVSDFAAAAGEQMDYLLRHPGMSRRRFAEALGLGGLVLALANCGGSGVTGPTGNPSVFSGNVVTLDGQPVNGVIHFLSPGGSSELGSGNIVNGSYSVDVSDGSSVRRVRILGLTGTDINGTELNYSGGKNFTVLKKKLGIGDEHPLGPEWGVSAENPSFYDIVNRHAPVQAPAGLRKVVSDLAFHVNSSNITGSVDERVGHIRNAIDELYEAITGRTWNGNLQVTQSPPAPGNGNVVFTCANQYYASPRYASNAITGGEIASGSISPTGRADRVELAGTLLFIGESDIIKPSLGNDNIDLESSHIQPVDHNIIAAARFQTLGTKKYVNGPTVIEDYEQIV
ncbi:hypothetical protein JW826_02520 [Candidatus Woesearchaeota archaeon]|nr:hypothetical protein [Candidatus Woesearchaeota archaeon]